ncbi:MAG: translocation/assembly module TamB domain-containing protein, partial [Rhodospirillaceae bacterium]
LAQVAGQLSGEGGGVLSGLSLMDSLRQGLGLDTLRISGDGEDGAPRLEAGTYVDDGVYVGLNQGATAGQSEVTVEVDLTDSITLETQAGGTDGAAVGVLWEWDY